jgi:uncharacterized protein Yka (UPF0111/DUF47 family)
MPFSVALWLTMLLVVQQIDKQPQIDSLWPSSIVGVIGTIMALLAFLDTVISRVKRPADAAAKRVEEKLTAEMRTQLASLSDKVTSFARETEKSLDNLQKDIQREAEDCAQRVSEIATRVKDSEAELHVLGRDMVQSREDRRHIAQDIVAWKVLIQEWRKEDKDRDERVLSALVALRGTGPG